MLKSMTGYGQGSASGADFKVTVDLRSVNHGALDIHWRAPHELAALEIPLKKHVQAAVSRGRVDVTVNFTQTRDASYELNRPLIRGYLNALHEMGAEFGLAGGADLAAIVRLSGALRSISEDQTLSDEIVQGVEAALTQALAALVAMRAVEGQELQKDLLARVKRVERLLAVVEADFASIAKINREKLRKEMLELSEGAAIDETLFARKLAYLADRCCGAEEIAGLKSHLAKLRGLLSAEGEVGKKIDFLLQEMNRKANVILSQATEIPICEMATEIKTEIEKLREQALNVE
jgi:uncharacterized protein (TIGR00255 family)